MCCLWPNGISASMLKEAIIMWVYVGMQVQGYIDLQVNCPIARVLSSYYQLLELVLLNLCNQCLTEFLKIRTCFKIVG